MLAKIFANPDLPEIDDYYEPFTFDYEHLQKAPELEAFPTARPRSLITGERMEKIEWGPNWEEILGGEFAKRSARTYNFEGVQKEIYGQFENTFMMYLPRLCEHCLNPACVAACPSGAIYKREEDGIVLIDQDKCRGWRMCVSGCPYKKIYYNWSSGKSEKCIFCYPRIEAGQPTVCSETCVGRIRYLGVVLYDADGIEEAASVEDEQDLYQAQLDIFLDPNDPSGDRAGARRRRAGGLARSRARSSPVWKMAMEWKVAFPLHPEYRTLPMVWYVPPLSPIQSAAEAGKMGIDGDMPDVRIAAHPAQVSRQPADRRRRGAGRAGRSSACSPCAPTCGPRPSTACIDETIAAQGRPHGPADRGHVPDHGDRQLRGPLRHPDRASRARRGRLRPARLLRLLVRQRLLGRPHRDRPVRRAKAQSQDPDGGRLMRKTLKVLSALLTYPDGRAAGGGPGDARGASTRKARLPQRNRDRLDRILEELATGDLYDLQERYVLLFDRTRSLSLHLFEHVHGESRDRGQAMVDLKALYERHGLFDELQRAARSSAAVPGVPVRPSPRPRPASCSARRRTCWRRSASG